MFLHLIISLFILVHAQSWIELNNLSIRVGLVAVFIWLSWIRIRLEYADLDLDSGAWKVTKMNK
jgi:hypothetical protein